MRLPVMRGLIDRRILVNYRVDPDALAALLPEPFRPQLVRGHGIAGICLIRLKDLRPRFVPKFLGLSSENAAHRIAVEWEQQGQTLQGVYVPRRDTNNRFNVCAGGRLFPGVQHHARFDVRETDDHFHIDITSDDGEVTLHVDASCSPALPADSVFESLEETSSFFKKGSLGYSSTRNLTRFDGLELRSTNWLVSPLDVQAVRSSFFEDESLIPAGAATFDHALLMRDIDHEWHSQTTLQACAC